MPRLMHLTILTKIILGFAMVLVLTTALGLVAMAGLNTVNTTASIVGTRFLPATRALGNVTFGAMRYRQLEATVALAPNPSARAAQEAIMAKARGETDQALALYQQLIAAPGQDATAELRAAWSDYQTLDQTYFRLLDASDPDAASALYMGDMRGRFHALQNALDQQAAHINDQGLSAVRHGAETGALAIRWIVAALVLAALLCCAVGTFLVYGISHPICGMTSAMRRLAGRDMATEIPCVGHRNEIGAMADAVSVFRDTMIAGDKLTAEREADQMVRQKRAALLETLVGRFEQEIGRTVTVLAAASTEMETTARSMTGTAARTDRQATEVAQAAEESSLGVQTVAAASAQLAASITEINRQVAASSSLSGRMVVTTRQADETVRTLAANAERIGEVVQLIDSIATQTNLLALNATIEAARAGDAGKGFAVVASEVKTLAHQTAHATGDIGALVTQMQQAGTSAVAAMRDIVALIDEVNATTTSIAAAVEQQGAATTEIARNVQQTATSTGTVTSSIAGVSQAANDTGAAAMQVLDAAGNLSRRTESLSSEVAGFIADVRRA